MGERRAAAGSHEELRAEPADRARILQSLASPAFMRQDPGNAPLPLGVGLFALGLAAPNPVEGLPELRGLLDALAHRPATRPISGPPGRRGALPCARRGSIADPHASL